MREEAMKLEKVKKSCNITAKVSGILEVILIVCAILCAISAVSCFAFKNQINEGIITVSANSSQEDFVKSLQSLDDAKLGGFLSFTFHTEKMIENGEYGQVIGIFCVVGAFTCAMVAIVFGLLSRVFKTIKASDTPFDEAVLKKIKKMFIVISVDILLLSGLGEAALAGLICWSIYNILDYGFTLQKQYDETL